MMVEVAAAIETRLITRVDVIYHLWNSSGQESAKKVVLKKQERNK